jgi:hypothetical protein
MRYRPTTKFGEIFWGIFGLLYTVALFGGLLFLIGYTVYKLFVRDFLFFKENGLIIVPFDAFVIFIAIRVIRSWRADKPKG